MIICEFAGEFLIGKSLTCNLRGDDAKAITVIQIFSIVKTKRLFIKVAEQMERLNTNIGAVDAAFQQTPKVINLLSVNATAHILISGMINRIVKVFRRQAVIRGVLGGEYFGSWLYV